MNKLLVEFKVEKEVREDDYGDYYGVMSILCTIHDEIIFNTVHKNGSVAINFNSKFASNRPEGLFLKPSLDLQNLDCELEYDDLEYEFDNIIELICSYSNGLSDINKQIIMKKTDASVLKSEIIRFEHNHQINNISCSDVRFLDYDEIDKRSETLKVVNGELIEIDTNEKISYNKFYNLKRFDIPTFPELINLYTGAERVSIDAFYESTEIDENTKSIKIFKRGELDGQETER